MDNEKNCAHPVLYSQSISRDNLLSLFSFSPNTTSILTDPTLLSDQKSIFGSGSFNNKFGINDLYESSFITGTRFKKYGLGLGFTRFGNFIYKETQVAVLSSRRIRDNIIFGGGIMVYNIAI